MGKVVEVVYQEMVEKRFRMEVTEEEYKGIVDFDKYGYDKFYDIEAAIIEKIGHGYVDESLSVRELDGTVITEY